MGCISRAGKDKCILISHGKRPDGSSTYRVRYALIFACMYETVFDCMCLYFAYICMYVTLLDCMYFYIRLLQRQCNAAAEILEPSIVLSLYVCDSMCIYVA